MSVFSLRWKMEVRHFAVKICFVLILATFNLVKTVVPRTLNTGIEECNVPRLTIDPKSISAPLGGTIHRKCEGYFGQLNSETTAVDWTAGDMKTNEYLYEKENLMRFNITSYQRNHGEFKGAILRIDNVTKGDYNILMLCILSSACTCCPTILRNFTVLPYVAPVVLRDDLGKIIAPVVVAFVLVVLLVSVILYHCWGPQIGLYTYSHCASATTTDDFTYDTIVIHDNTDNVFASEHIKPYLSGLTHLRVEYIGRNLSGGAPLFEGIQDLIRESFCIMFVVTQDVNPVLFGHLLKAAKELKRKIIVIMSHPEGLKLHRWHRQNEYSIDLRDLQQKYLRYLLTIKWPGNQASNRRRQNFWCTVRRQLPLPTHSSPEA